MRRLKEKKKTSADRSRRGEKIKGRCWGRIEKKLRASVKDTGNREEILV